jgi:hypothetical protein
MYSPSTGSQESVPLALPRVWMGLIVLLVGGFGGLIFVVSVFGVSRPVEPPCVACYIGAFRPPLEPYRHPRPDTAANANPAPPPASTAPGMRLADGPRRVVVTPALMQPPGGGSMAPMDGIAVPATSTVQRFQAAEPAGLGIVSGAPERPSWHDWPGSGVPLAALAVERLPTWSLSWARSEASSTPAVPPGLSADGGAAGQWSELPGADRTASRDIGGESPHPTWLVPIAVTAWTDSFAPHWRVAVQQDLERHFPQVGGGGLNPGQAAAAPDGFAGIAGGTVPMGINSVPAAGEQPISEMALPLGGGFSLQGMDGTKSSDTARGGAPNRFAVAVTPPIQYFPVAGPTNDVQYFWPDVRPNNSGVSAGLAYTPWTRPAPDLPFVNLGVGARYAPNKEFSGAVRGAGGNNTLVLSLWGALHF